MAMSGNTKLSLLTGLIAVAGLTAAPSASFAQKYPSQDIHLICAFPPGSGSDVVVRYYAEKLRQKAGVTVLVENRPGVAGNLAAEYTVRSKPDGYTIYLHTGSALASNFWLYKKPPIDPVKDLQVVATMNVQPFMVMVPTNSPYKSLRELTAARKAKGDKASYAESNSVGKVMGELYKTATGVNAVDVPYRTAPDTLNDFASGAVDYGMMDPQFSTAQANAGRLRMLAVSMANRMQSLPDVPTMKEQGADVEIVGWFAANVPAATPKPVVEQLNKWFNEITGTDETRKFLAGFGTDVWMSTPEEGQARLVKDKAAWQGYVKAAKIEPQ
jgi:tripartite-type tricarboxylate transporter receptor subunit TctC